MFPTALVRPVWTVMLRSLRLLTRLAMAAVVLAFGLGAGQPALAAPPPAAPPAIETVDTGSRGTAPGAHSTDLHSRGIDLRWRGVETTSGELAGSLTTGEAFDRSSAPRPGVDAPSVPVSAPVPAEGSDQPVDEPACGATGLRGPPLS